MNATGPQLTIQTILNPLELYTDSRTHGYQGPSRNVRLARVTPAGAGGAIAKSEDGTRCAVVGHNHLKILRICEPSPTSQKPEHKSAIGEGGHRIEVSRNFWDSSVLKVDSVSTDVAWGCGQYNNKILTSARNGEIIVWDLNRAGNTKYERRAKDHIRSVNTVSISNIVHYYCVSGSNDGDVRVWDLRDMSKSIMRVHHPTAVRSLVFSPSAWQPLQVVVGLESGSIYRWDLKMGQRGGLDRLHVAHTKAVMALDWCPSGGVSLPVAPGSTPIAAQDVASGGLGWLASGALDHTVKIWDLTSPSLGSHIPQKPTYTLHTSFPVRRIAWRPGYETELAVVSTAEHATSADALLQHTSTGTASGYLTRVGSTADLSALLRVPSNLDLLKEKLALHSLNEGKNPALSSDAIEIWDVRRGWIGKWSVSGSGAEGGVSDIVFNDSHAIWAQQTSGAFSQFDLREVTKPLDSVPRVASAWDATGSMTFVADRPDRWEVPYDDINPEVKNQVEMRRPCIKSLGDPQAQIPTQVTATYSHDFLDNDLDTFTSLARGYIFEGRDRRDICAVNAGAALGAGNESAAQVWLLLGASLSDYVPVLPPEKPASPQLDASYTTSSPKLSSLGGSGRKHPAATTKTSIDTALLHRTSPGRASSNGTLSRLVSSSVARRLTPTSSTSTSPHHLSNALPPVTPRRASNFSHREVVESSLSKAAMLRRPSISVAPGSQGGISYSSSPSDKNGSSHRHVGEGVLDDESSSEEDEVVSNARPNEGELTLSLGHSEESGHPQRFTRASPSPLSNAAGDNNQYDLLGFMGRLQVDEEDDDSASTPSPQSTSDTETDSQSSGSPRKRSTVRSRSNSHSSKSVKRGSHSRTNKSRSRSSTLASLAAVPRSRSLSHQESSSSIRTVTAVETSFRDLEDEDHDGTETNGSTHPDADKLSHRRQKSIAMSEYIPNSSMRSIIHAEFEDDEFKDNYEPSTERRMEDVLTEDKRFKETTLATLREALEQYMEDGDVQMCAMLALVASEDLRVSQFKKTRLIDAYIELLIRLRLHTCAAYIRKFSDLEAVKKPTLVGTVIYTSCGRCRKALIVPAGPSNTADGFQGRWAYCSNCQVPAVMCCICRLPVRAMLFQCSTCHHGGHLDCYKQYYMLSSPMIELPTSFIPSSNDLRGRPSTRPPPFSASSMVDDDAQSTMSMQSSVLDASTQNVKRASRVTSSKGNRCAAGCGHFCWATSGNAEEL